MKTAAQKFSDIGTQIEELQKSIAALRYEHGRSLRKRELMSKAVEATDLLFMAKAIMNNISKGLSE